MEDALEPASPWEDGVEERIAKLVEVARKLEVQKRQEEEERRLLEAMRSKIHFRCPFGRETYQSFHDFHAHFNSLIELLKNVHGYTEEYGNIVKILSELFRHAVKERNDRQTEFLDSIITIEEALQRLGVVPNELPEQQEGQQLEEIDAANGDDNDGEKGD